MDLNFATDFHKFAFDKTINFLKSYKEVLAVCITGSAARNEGSFDSDIDLNVFVDNELDGSLISTKFNEFKLSFEKSEVTGKYFDIEIHIIDYKIKPSKRSWTSGPDDFELEIGNIFVYTKLIFQNNNYFTNLQKEFLPYYEEELRTKRLSEVLKFCTNNIGHIEPYVKRGLYFQAYKRLYDANREFLQALFISRKIYPIAYDKWVKKQLVEILQLPELYTEYVKLYELNNLESNELIEKSKSLDLLIEKYIL